MHLCGKLVLVATPMFAMGATHELRVTTLYREGLAPRGAVLQVCVDGGAPASKPVRLLLDTGAKDILLDGKAAAAAGLSASGAGRAVGFGGSAVTTGVTSANIRVGTFEARQVPIQIAGTRPLMAGVDGLIGANVFRAYVIEIDVRRNRLRLLPREAYTPAGAVRFRSKGHLVYVDAGAAGLALLDTGASYSVLDERMAPASANRDATAPLRGVSGELAGGGFRLPPVRFEVGPAVLWDREPMGIDLQQLREQDGVQFSAVIGYPALRDTVLQLDYESQTLRFLRSR